jgi:hypothetical protein
MALKKSTAKPAAAATPPAEPVNGAQEDALEQLRQEAGTDSPERVVAPGPTVGELEERTVEAEERAAAAEGQVLTLQEEMELLKRQMAMLLRAQRASPRKTDTVDQEAAGAEVDADAPVFDEDAPYGLVVGDTDAAYVQDGHQFGKDRRYLATERNHGSPRAFNPKLIGVVKLRPNQERVDVLDGIRGN